jgi:hypothetical protein
MPTRVVGMVKAGEAGTLWLDRAFLISSQPNRQKRGGQTTPSNTTCTGGRTGFRLLKCVRILPCLDARGSILDAH